MQGNASPQRFGTTANALITVGSVNGMGRKSLFNIPPGPPQPLINPPETLETNTVGTISIYANADTIAVADGRPGGSGLWEGVYGTSFATPQIGGLAAYILGLPRDNIPLLHTLSMNMKRTLVRLARDNSRDGEGVAYNGVHELLCSTPILKRSLMPNDTENEEVDVRSLADMKAFWSPSWVHA